MEIILSVKDTNNIYWAWSNTEWSTGNYTATWEDDKWHFQGNGVNAAYVNLMVNNSNHEFDGTIDLIFDFDFLAKNSCSLYLVDNTGSRRDIFGVSSFNIENHYRWMYTASTGIVLVYINGEYSSSVDLSSYNFTTIGFQIVDWQGDLDCTLHDFKICKR